MPKRESRLAIKMKEILKKKIEYWGVEETASTLCMIAFALIIFLLFQFIGEKMPITNEKSWKEWEEANRDSSYGKCCVDIARQVMKILDDEDKSFDPHEIICRAEKEIGESGITGFMASAIAQMVSHCHSRGDEFKNRAANDGTLG